MPSPLTVVGFQQIGNAPGGVNADTTAFAHRTANYELLMLSVWLDPAEDNDNIGWMRNLAE